MKKTNDLPDRIAHLDGLRGVAILAVLGYHYFSRFADWDKPVYPYGPMLAEFVPFQYGYYGVQLFFAISGFVIALTLERCRSVDEFAVRRFARLWPTMLLCSSLTYLVLSIWPTFWPQSPANFLPSLTFIDGQVWNKLIDGLDAGWIDGAYWSLFVEVRFYALAAAIYFLNRERFILSFTGFSIVVVCAHAMLRAVGQVYWADLLQQAFVAKYLPWFMLGIGALLHFRDRRHAGWIVMAVAISLLGLLASVGEKKTDLLVSAMVIALMLAPTRYPWVAQSLRQPWLVGVGVASYSLYLLHQNAGLTLISLTTGYLGLTGTATLAAPIVVVLGFILASRTIYNHFESPLSRSIVNTYKAVRFKWLLRPA